MAADLNRVTLVGRLTKDPELRHTASETAVCAIRLALTSRTKDEAGDWTDRPNYFDVTVFGRQAETASTYLTKGRRIGVDGRLSWREWQAQDGSRRQGVEVIANDVFFLDSPREDAQDGSGWRDQAPAEPATVPAGAAGAPDAGDIPF